MTSHLHDSSAADMALARQAGAIHGQLLAALAPWIRADEPGRQRLQAEALARLGRSGQVSDEEFRVINKTLGLLDQPGTTQGSFLDHLGNEQQQAERRAASPVMTVFLGVGQDSASRSMSASTKADLVGAVIGAGWGVGGALAGASVLSSLELSSTPAY